MESKAGSEEAMIVLVDYNLNRQAILISGSLIISGLLDLALIQLSQ
jgi:hypothetical protein